MLRWIIICCLFCNSIFAKQKPENYVSICTIFRDEARFLEEWIEYHRMIGVEKFYLYNNLSEDHYLDVLSPYIASKTVKLIDWPYMDKNWVSEVQCTAYNHCLKKYGKKSYWIAEVVPRVKTKNHNF